jgi:thiamine-monophosphate kinase
MKNAISEFEVIERFFESLSICRKDVSLGIGDDAALIQIPPKKLLVSTTDSFIEGTHFFKDAPSDAIGYKALAVNLSDLAAMGSTPCWISLAISLPYIDTAWLEGFANGFGALLKAFNVQLIGGDTTKGHLSITVQALGVVDPDKVLRRSAAQVGDHIYVTGSLGDAACALTMLECNQTPDAALLKKLYYPTPRVSAGIALGGIANAAIDISDGLLADLNHILMRSDVGATIFLEKLPLSSALTKNVSLEVARQYALSGGDDYELCFTVSSEKEKAFQMALSALHCHYTMIGIIEARKGLYLETSTDRKRVTNIRGYQHF